VGAHAVTIVGAGLAGCECAWQCAQAGLDVRLLEMRPHRRSPAHGGDHLAELVCSNSFRSDNPDNAVGLLHAELRLAGSLVLAVADRTRVPAGDALAVDREAFSEAVESAIVGHPRIRLVREECARVPDDDAVVVATGPLTSDALAQDLVARTGADRLAFFDAIAPIVDADSIDWDAVFLQSRWDKGEGADYVNCPMERDAYDAFVDALNAAEKVPVEEFEKDVHYFSGCQPIEVIAASGHDALRYGPMKPVGLRDPKSGRRPWAVVQLRSENRAKTAYNLVGFQTKLRHGEQRRVLRTIPGLAHAEFLRLGSVHRNTFVDSPCLLDVEMRLRSEPRVRFAGQVTGVEGYVESTASGLWVAMALIDRLVADRAPVPPPPTTALGAMLAHVVNEATPQFQPSNVNFGLFAPIQGVRKHERRLAMVDRARSDLAAWLAARDRVGVDSPTQEA